MSLSWSEWCAHTPSYLQMVSRCSHKLVATLPGIYMSLSVIMKSCHACLSHSCNLRCLHVGMRLLQNVGHMAQVICPSTTRCLDVPFPVFVGTTCSCILLILVHVPRGRLMPIMRDIPHFLDMYVPQLFCASTTCTGVVCLWYMYRSLWHVGYMYHSLSVLVHVPVWPGLGTCTKGGCPIPVL